MQSDSEYKGLAVFADKVRRLPQTGGNHKLQQGKVTKVNKNSDNINKIVKKYIDEPEARVNTFKELSNGVYIGPLDSSDRPDGKGVIKYNDKSQFYGTFDSGKAEGKGLMIYSEDRYYFGDFQDGNFDGEGEYHCKEYIYNGKFKDNAFDGNGTMDFPNSGRFDGKFKDGQMEQGVLSWETSTFDKNKKKVVSKFEYTGEFKNNKFHDLKAKLKTPSGIYEGQFVNGVKEGQGHFKFKEKYQYIGSYKNNLKEGQGTLYNPDTTAEGQNNYSTEEKSISYRGNFRNNIPHGMGSIYHAKDQKMMDAQYDDGIYVKVFENNEQ